MGKHALIEAQPSYRGSRDEIKMRYKSRKQMVKYIYDIKYIKTVWKELERKT